MKSISSWSYFLVFCCNWSCFLSTTMTVWKFHWFWHQLYDFIFISNSHRQFSNCWEGDKKKKFPQQSTSLKKKWERLDSVLNINFHFIQIEKWWNISYKLVIIDKDMFPLCSSMTDTHIHTEPLCIEWWWDERAWREKENYLVMSPRTLKLNL